MRNFYLLVLLSLCSLCSFGQGPVINSFSPASAGQGSTITINGINFSEVTSVTIGGVPASIIEVSPTRISVEVGFGASGDVVVTTPQGSSSKPDFTFLSRLTGFSPGSATSGTKVTITGTYLLGATAVKFGGKPAASFEVVNATTIEAVVGLGASGTVSVTLPTSSPSPRSGFQFFGITSFAPTIAKEGETVTLTGTNLTGVSSVKFGGVEASSFTINSPTSITAIVGKASTGDVSVTTPVGISVLSGFTFIADKNAPTITSFSPAEATTGDLVTINGSNLAEATLVKFGGSEATIVSNTASTITAIVKEGSSGDVLVITPHGEASRTGFTFLDPPPVITSFFPTSGGEGTTVTIAGQNLGEVYIVRFGSISADFKLNDDGTITAIVGSGATGPVSVVSTAGRTATTDLFTFQDIIQPQITSFTPASASEGEEVVITGTNLEGATSVSFGTVEANSFSVNSSTSITAIVAKGASGDIAIETPSGKVTAPGFTYLDLSPRITSFSPAKGSKGTLVDIEGINFVDVSSVTFGGTEASSITVNSPTSITAVVGDGTSGSISVVTKVNTATAPGFTFISNPPSISLFSPKSGFTGAAIVIIGTNFHDITSVRFGGIEASFKVNTPTSITAFVPPGSTGDVTVISASGSVSKEGFKYIEPLPAVSSFVPTRAAANTTVAIQGSSFINVTSVKFGRTEAKSFIVESDSRIIAVVGEGSSGDVTVTTESGTGQPRGGFTYISTPVINSFSPDKAKSGTAVTILGSNFEGVTSVMFGNIEAASFQVVSSTMITAVVGNGANGDISVVCSGGTAYAQGFTFLLAPGITSFSPTSAGENEEITIRGTNLSETSRISFGGVEAKSIKISSASLITAVLGKGGSGQVAVETPGGTATKDGFTFIPPPSISNFSPAVATTGAFVTITGENFTEGSLVSFGGEPASSVIVVSPTSITAILGKGASGAVSVATRGGIAETSGFTFVPDLKILSDGPTTFSTGNSVVLRVNTGLAYSYQWARNGVDILGAKGDSYTAVTSGSYTVRMVVGDYRITSEPLIVNTVFTLAPNNFKILSRDESCSSSNNGSVEITAEKYLKYSVRITGDNLDQSFTFYLTQKIENLPKGDYTLCITVDEDRDYKQYFDIHISEPEDLSVYSSVEDHKLVLQLKGGERYRVSLNGKEFITSDSSLSLGLLEGENKLSVSTDKDCQGIFRKTIIVKGNPLVYPNPFGESFDIALQNASGNINVEIQGLDGKLVYKQMHTVQNGLITIRPMTLAPGMYLLKLQSHELTSVTKIVKK